jgi:flagellar biosynthetic protein FliQ
MDEAALLEVSRDAVIVVLKIGTPIMLISLIVGLVISLFQALTQIPEATLTFVPNILVSSSPCCCWRPSCCTC